jgi:ABC-type sugar transport system permease subunit
MMNPDILFYIIKLAVYGIVTFLAILLMSKMRDAAWMSVICGFLFNYAGTVCDILIELGILSKGQIMIFGIPLLSLLCLVLPAAFFTAGFIIMLCRKF